MTNEIKMGLSLTDAMIQLKNGKVKYGMLIEEAVNETYRFISGTNYSSYRKNQDPDYIENLHSSEIHSIDTSLK